MATSPPPVERIALSVPDALHAIGISRSTLYLMMDSGELTFVKIRGRRVIPVSALRALVGDTELTTARHRRPDRAGTAR